MLRGDVALNERHHETVTTTPFPKVARWGTASPSKHLHFCC